LTFLSLKLIQFSHRYEYRWADGVTIKKPIEVSAPKYVEYLMDWIESQLDDESIFPQKLGRLSSCYVNAAYCIPRLPSPPPKKKRGEKFCFLCLCMKYNEC